MTSLALATHAAAAPPFNGLFYATAATVIPVLFLAVTIQGRIYQDLVNAAAAARRQMQPATGLRRTIAGTASLALLYLALLYIAATIVTYGVASEIVAVVALYQQHDRGLGVLVLTGTIFMIIVAAGPPALAPFRQDRPLPRDAPAQDVTHAASPETGATPAQESGKTDT